MMNVKENVLLICSVSFLSSVVWSGPPPLTHHNANNSLSTGTGRKRPPSLGEDAMTQHRSKQVPTDLDRSWTSTSAHRLNSSDTNDLQRRRSSQTRRSPHPSTSPLDCGEGRITFRTPGKFYIVGKLEPNVPNSDFQSDSAPSVQAEGQLKTPGEESWQTLQPVVECGGDSMVLQVSRRRAGHLLVLPGANESSVLLTQLTPGCGYDVQTTTRHLSLEAQYDACHVTQEADSFVLPLLWRGVTVKVSCPVPRLQPVVTDQFSLCCYDQGLMVQVRGPSPVEKLKINVRGQWLPLVGLAEQCGYTVDRRQADMVISAPFFSCGTSVKDGEQTLYLQLEKITLTLSCPVSPPQGPTLAPQPHVDQRQHLNRKPGNMESFLWATPFYLAPLHYPHPTYHHQTPRPSVDPPPPLPLNPDPHPVVEPQMDVTDYSSGQIPIGGTLHVHRPQNNLEDSGLVPPGPDPQAGGSVPVEALPGRTFSPYYQYYHHSKIPLHHPDLRPHVQADIVPHIPHNPVPPPNVQQMATDSDQLPEPGTVSSVGGDEAVVRGPPVPQLHHIFYYIPYILKTEAQTDDQDMATNAPHLHQSSPSDDLQSQEKILLTPSTGCSNSEGKINMEDGRSVEMKTLLPDVGGTDPGSEDPQKPGSPHTYPSDLSPVDSHPHQLFSHPRDQRPHQVSDGNNVWSPEAALLLPDTTQHPHHSKPEDLKIFAESEPLYQTNLQLPNSPLYYNYYPLYQPQASAELQEPEGFTSKTQFPADTGHSANVSSDAPAFPDVPELQHSAPSGLFVLDFEPWHQLNSPDGEITEERLDEESQDCLEQPLLFVLPYPVLEPILILQSPEGGDVPFSLQPLTSELENGLQPADPLTGHGFEPAVHHWLHGQMMDINPLDPSVGVDLSVKDGPSLSARPQTVAAETTVELRIATNELFTTFYPEAPLPLSQVQGRPLHLELRLLDPPDPDLVLLVQFCLAVSPAPQPAWIPIYDPCSTRSDSGPLPSSNHIRRIKISNFLFPTPESPFHTSEGDDCPHSDTQEPQIHFLCSTNICSAADTGCTVGCDNRFSHVT